MGLGNLVRSATSRSAVPKANQRKSRSARAFIPAWFFRGHGGISFSHSLEQFLPVFSIGFPTAHLGFPFPFLVYRLLSAPDEAHQSRSDRDLQHFAPI
jgi:hypothetical protein